MISTTKQNKIKQFAIKTLKIVVVTLLWIFVWEVVSRLVARNNENMYILLPRPVTVLKTWLDIAFTSEYLLAVKSTLLRVFWGFLLGVISGFSLGVATHISKIANIVLSPMMKTVRAIPVVAISILFFALFSGDALPISVIFLMVMPLIWQTVHDSLATPDRELVEMAKIYRLNNFKVFVFIKLPSLLPSLLTATVNALGLAWKSGIAAEVICDHKSGLGNVLSTGKGMADFDQVYAVTLTVVILSIIIEILLKSICKRFVESRRNDA